MRMNSGSPVLVEEFYENAEEIFVPPPTPWLKHEIDVDQLNGNFSNMVHYNLDLSEYQGNQVN